MPDVTHDLDPALYSQAHWQLYTAPGSVMDLMVELAYRDFVEPMDEYELEISAKYGLQFGAPCFVANSQETVRIPLPEDKTVGDLLAAVLVCSLPALILHALRATNDDGESGCSIKPAMVNDGVARFLDVLKTFDGGEIQRQIKDAFEEATSETTHSQEV